MKLKQCGALFILIVGSLQASTYGKQPEPKPTVVVMQTADAPGIVNPEDISQGLQYVLDELHLAGQMLLQVVVFHLSEASARQLGVQVTSNWRNSGDDPRYEMWIVGKPSKVIYSLMVESIAEHQFGVQLDEFERARVVRAVD